MPRQFLKCDQSTVGELVATGELPCAKIGRAQVFMEDDLINYLRKETSKQTAARLSAIEASAELPRRPIGRPRNKLPKLDCEI